MSDDMKRSQQSSWLDGANASWLESMYETYLENPDSVEPKWRKQFEILKADIESGQTEIAHSKVRHQFKQSALRRNAHLNCRQAISSVDLNKNTTTSVDATLERKQVRVLQIINAFRILGHFKANLNPLYTENTTHIPELTLDYHELTKSDLKLEFDTGSLNTDDRASLEKILQILDHTYCHTIGAEYMHISETTEKRWIQKKLESIASIPTLHYKARQRILRRLTAAEGLEKYLHTRYVGQKRFSLEGAESLIPLLDEIVQSSATYGIKESVIGMAHRGRLNVLINILGKTPAELFDEFEGKKETGDYMGDVKYHMGFSSDILTPHSSMHLTLAFNPSHLEIVSPVVEGSVRARQERRFDQTGDQIIPIQIHGDSAFAGQGVVMETFQMSQARGYSTKGTIHIVINNQIGFTTSNVKDVRSTQYCTEVSKMINAPIFHVNGDDPEAVVFVAKLALDYRIKFKKDVVIDMICYRRHGHNEADEPSATQPMMYKIIKALPTTRELYVQKLNQAEIFTLDESEQLKKDYRDKLESGQCVAPNISSIIDDSYAFHWKKYVGNQSNLPIESGVDLNTVKFLMDQLEQLPTEFERHARVEKIISDRHKMTAGALPIDWGYAETLAYAALINDGYNIRLSGQDSGRGTFFHRHVVWHNQLKKEAWVPLREMKGNKAEKTGNFLVIDSLLSEEAVLAFEYGYASTDPETLVIWEAQFGDFANNAQVVIDQFISAGEQKWQRLCGLVMLLPHGFEGQGAEHSSARLERFLQLCAQNNMQVCVPSTPAQVFHMLRRQMLQNTRKPLICMSPKSLLRHKSAVSTLEEISSGTFKTVIDDVDTLSSPKASKSITRIVLCSGKVYYDLLESKTLNDLNHIALIRLEQLYPFPQQELQKIIKRYKNSTEIIWCQEEPRNQGAWYNIRHHLETLISNQKSMTLIYAGRIASAAPAVGVARIHVAQQKKLVNQALGLESDIQ
ncbi:MAG: 2-oxoglutarate dehydrogenase E1 component [Gammaproteobacteria bacterium]|nr:2-oxoglutarate dehydrogenase E1 component [Gammaproteobacteria bacterium]